MKKKKIKSQLEIPEDLSNRLKDLGVKVQTMAYLLGSQDSAAMPLNKSDMDYGTELILQELGLEIENLGRKVEFEEIKRSKIK